MLFQSWGSCLPPSLHWLLSLYLFYKHHFQSFSLYLAGRRKTHLLLFPQKRKSCNLYFKMLLSLLPFWACITFNFKITLSINTNLCQFWLVNCLIILITFPIFNFFIPYNTCNWMPVQYYFLALDIWGIFRSHLSLVGTQLSFWRSLILGRSVLI